MVEHQPQARPSAATEASPPYSQPFLRDALPKVRRRIQHPLYHGPLRSRLLIAHLVVLALALATVFLAVGLSAPSFFAGQVAAMARAHGAAGGMGQVSGPLGMAGREGVALALDAAVAGAYRRSLNDALVLAGIAGGAVAVVLSLLLSQRIAGPVHRLAAASRRIAAGHYAERVPAPPDDPQELADLAQSFNAMATSLEATERRRLELLGDVAHELRTPVAAIEGYLEGLLDGVIAPSDQLWAKLDAEAGRVHRLIEDLQDLSRAEAHQMPLAVRPTDPAVVAKAAAERLTGDFAAKGLALHVNVAPGLPLVPADADRAVQVLTNLLTNALRYTPAPGHVHLRVSETGGMVRFDVTDTGIGLAPEDLARVFERFYRVDRSRARASGGTGIGLTIAKALVEAMGGRIWATSPGPGQGATFSFELPRAR